MRLNYSVKVSDARFRKDSYYIESTGVAGPFLVDWAKTNLAYLKAAKKIEGTLKRAEEKKMEVCITATAFLDIMADVFVHHIICFVIGSSITHHGPKQAKGIG